MCRSWPQAWSTGTRCPSASWVVTVLAYGAPVSSLTGSASSSQRSSTAGPRPLASAPTTPVPPMCSSTVKP